MTIGKPRMNRPKKSTTLVFRSLIVDLAVIREGIILSNDFYRDLLQDSGEAVKKVIRER